MIELAICFVAVIVLHAIGFALESMFMIVPRPWTKVDKESGEKQ
jgi:hypothetical protein